MTEEEKFKGLDLYGGRELNCKQDHLGWFCCLSNNLVLKPWHCCDSNDTNIEYEMEEYDLAIVKVKGVHETSMFVCTILGELGSNYKLSDNTSVRKVEDIDTYHAVFSLDHGIEPGYSGTIIFYEGNMRSHRDGAEFNGKSPMYMIIARSNGNSSQVLAVSLPHLLKLIRDKDVNVGNALLRGQYADTSVRAFNPVLGVPDFHVKWEYVSDDKDTLRVVIRKAAEPLSDDVKTTNIDKLTSGQRFDEVFVQQLKNRGKDPYDTNANFLYNALSIAEAVGHEHKCWVVAADKQKSNRQNALYRIVSTYMEEFSMNNIGFSEGGAEVSLYQHSSHPLTVDKKLHDIWIGGKHSVCHHPFLCERGDHCRGEKMRANGKSASAGEKSVHAGKKSVSVGKKSASAGEESASASEESASAGEKSASAGEESASAGEKSASAGDKKRKRDGGAAELVSEADQLVPEPTNVKKPEISHCCIRPSHLIKLNNGFNTFCTGTLQPLFDAYPNENVSVAVGWKKQDESS